jgi:hypothetical protein
MVTAVKKAWLQSSPWMIVALLFLAAALVPPRWWERVMGPAPQRPLRLMSFVVFSTLAMFSASGFGRTDGLCFNQRYFCELVPMVAVAFAWAVEGVARWRTALLAGGLAGLGLVFVSLQPNHLTPIRHYALMYLPLALAVSLAAAWLYPRARGPQVSLESSSSALLAFLVGATLAWGTGTHLGDDVPATRIMRKIRLQSLRQLQAHVGDHSALFVSRGIMDAVGPLALDRDVVIAVPSLDQAKTTAQLLDAFLDQGRRVFIDPDALSKDRFDEVLGGRRIRILGQPPLLIEVGDR